MELATLNTHCHQTIDPSETDARMCLPVMPGNFLAENTVKGWLVSSAIIVDVCPSSLSAKSKLSTRDMMDTPISHVES